MAIHIGMLFIVAQVSAAQTPLQPEEAPAGVRFLATAATSEELAGPFRATLSWRDADGAQFHVERGRPGRRLSPAVAIECAIVLLARWRLHHSKARRHTPYLSL
jgi:hypothetical protein